MLRLSHATRESKNFILLIALNIAAKPYRHAGL